MKNNTEIFKGLLKALEQVKKPNQYYYFMGLLAMAKKTNSINQNEYDYFFDKVISMKMNMEG